MPGRCSGRIRGAVRGATGGGRMRGKAGVASGGTQSALIGGADTLGEWHARD